MTVCVCVCVYAGVCRPWVRGVIVGNPALYACMCLSLGN